MIWSPESGIDPSTAAAGAAGGIITGTGLVGQTFLNYLDAFGVTDTHAHQAQLSADQRAAALLQKQSAEISAAAQARTEANQVQMVTYFAVAAVVGIVAWRYLGK
jgi:aspartate-semialdehyde dehydrogenase